MDMLLISGKISTVNQLWHWPRLLTKANLEGKKRESMRIQWSTLDTQLVPMQPDIQVFRKSKHFTFRLVLNLILLLMILIHSEFFTQCLHAVDHTLRLHSKIMQDFKSYNSPGLAWNIMCLITRDLSLMSVHLPYEMCGVSCHIWFQFFRL